MPTRGGNWCRYSIILIIPLFIAFLSSIYYNLSDSQLQESEDGQLSSVDKECISKSEKDPSEKDNKDNNELQNSEKINNLALEQTLVKQEIKQINKKIDMGVVKENNIDAQYGKEIQTVKETTQSQFDKAFEDIKSLKDSLKFLENDFGTLKDKMRELWTVDDELRRLERSVMQKKANLENRIHQIEQNEEGNSEKIKQLSKQNSDIGEKIQQQVERTNKESKENEVRGITSNRVDILQIFLITILFIYNMYNVIMIWKEKSRKNRLKINHFRGGGKVPLVISFTENCKRSHEDLMREFIDSYDSLVMKTSKDIPKIHLIHSEVFLVFVDFNERNIILEGDREPQQIKRKTVEYIRNKGRTAVVIYHLHPDSRTLQDGRLYSSKLTSIEYHPTLKELSSRDCVLSIYRQFSEYQKARLKDIFNLG